MNPQEFEDWMIAQAEEMEECPPELLPPVNPKKRKAPPTKNGPPTKKQRYDKKRYQARKKAKAVAPPKTAQQKEASDKAKLFNKKRWSLLALTSFQFHKKVLHLLSDSWLEERFGCMFRHMKVVVETCPHTGKLHCHIAAQPLKGKRPRAPKIRSLFNDPVIDFKVVGNYPGWVDYCDPNYLCTDQSKPHFQRRKREYTHFAGPFSFGEYAGVGSRQDLLTVRAALWSGEFKTLKQWFASEWGLHPISINNRKWVLDQWFARPHPEMKCKLNDVQKFIMFVAQLARENNRQRPMRLGRQFLIVADPDGHCGKTVLATYLVSKGLGMEMCGKTDDLKYIYAKMPTPYLIYDQTRSDKFGNPPALPFYSIEAFSKGQYTFGKYEGGVNIFHTPFPIVFTNRSLDQLRTDISARRVTSDRWIILSRENGYLQRYDVDSNYEAYPVLNQRMKVPKNMCKIERKDLVTINADVLSKFEI